MKLLMEQWKSYLDDTEGVYYHVTRSETVPSIMRVGLQPANPADMKDAKGVYMFKSKESAEDALMNWLGDRFGEDEPLTLLRVDAAGVEELDTDAASGFEAISKTTIAPEFISVEPVEI